MLKIDRSIGGGGIPPPSTIDNQWIRGLGRTALKASVSDPVMYWLGIMKFCDTFNTETSPLLSKFYTPSSFADVDIAILSSPQALLRILNQLWVVTWRQSSESSAGSGSTAQRHRESSDRFLLERSFQAASRVARKANSSLANNTMLDLDTPFDACVFAITACPFWGDCQE